MSYDIACLFIKRKGAEDAPAELIVAWDAWSIEENYEGWQAACAKEIASIGSDIAAMRFVNLRVPDDQIDEAFKEWRVIPVERVSELEDPRTM